MSRFKTTEVLYKSIAQAAADWIESTLAMLSEYPGWASPIEERMFLGLALAAQRNRYAVDLYTADGKRSRHVLDDLSQPPRALVDRDGKWEPFVHVPQRVGYADHNEGAFGYASGMYAIRVFQQVEIQKYRADMLVEWTWDGFNYDQHGTRQPPMFAVIECDGHDFHERTKEQAKRDRRRDREIQGLGLPVLRFTGSEIYADPIGCGRQAINYFVDAMNRRAEKEIGGSVVSRLSDSDEEE